MSVKPLDRRIRKTQTALNRALMALLHRHDWDSITIQMICSEADVARSSFYVHFDNKVELLDHCITSGFEEARASIAEAPQSAPASEINTLSWLVDHIMSEKDFFLRVANSVSGQIVFTRFRAAVHRMLSDELASKGDQQSPDIAMYLLGGSFALIQQWIASGTRATPREMKTTLQQLAARLR